MSDAPPAPAATGTFAKTPFAHLVLYLYQRRSSGTLIARVALGEFRVLFHRGRAVAAYVPRPEPSLDLSLLPLAAADSGAFEFHEDDLVGSGAGVVTGMFDPCAFVVEAVRRHARPDIVSALVAKYSACTVALDTAMDLSRLSLSPEELEFAAPLLRGPVAFDALVNQSGLPPFAARRLVYTLLITRAIAPETTGTTGESQRDLESRSPAQPQPARRRSSGDISLPPRSLSGQLRPSGDAWRAIASRAGEISDAPRPSNQNWPAATRSPRPPMHSSPRIVETPLTPPPERPGDTQPLRTDSRPIARASGTSMPAQRAASRPLTEPLPSVSSGSHRAAYESRPLTPPPSSRDSAPLGTPRVTPGPAARSSPRPRAPDIDTLDADGKFRRVELLCQRNGYDEALPIMRMLLEEDRKSAKYLGMLAHVLFGRTIADAAISKEIIDSVNQALRIDPDQLHALYTKARCYKRLGKEREALHYFRRTVAVDPSHLDAMREVRLLVSRLSEKRKR